jgi:hypothetical protein
VFLRFVSDLTDRSECNFDYFFFVYLNKKPNTKTGGMKERDTEETDRRE